MYKLALIILALATLILSAGCGSRMWQDTTKTAGDTIHWATDTSPTARTYHEQAEIPLIEINKDAADVLYSGISGYELSKKSPVYVAIFTNQQNPNDKSIFGTIVTEQVSGRLVQRGIHIRDGKPKPEEYFLPPGIDPQKYQNPSMGSIDKLPPRAAMLNGYYVIGDNMVYMSARITRLDDKTDIAHTNWTIPITENIRQLIPHLQRKDGLDPSVKTKF